MTALEREPLLHRLAGQFATAADGSEVHEVPGFRVWPTPDPFYRNVAIPTDRPRDWAPAIAAMDSASPRVAGRRGSSSSPISGPSCRRRWYARVSGRSAGPR